MCPSAALPFVSKTKLEGRQIELVRGHRIVQAWRFGAAHPSCWDAGVYSVVRFTLSGQDDGTRFIIDHAGVPPRWHDHISSGYPTFYQQPLERYFAALVRP